MSSNRAILIGRISNKPELKEADSVVYTVFKLCNTTVTKGEEIINWHNIKAIGKQAKVCCQYLNKGDLCCIEGHFDEDCINKERTSVFAERVTFLVSAKRNTEDN